MVNLTSTACQDGIGRHLGGPENADIEARARRTAARSCAQTAVRACVHVEHVRKTEQPSSRAYREPDRATRAKSQYR